MSTPTHGENPIRLVTNAVDEPQKVGENSKKHASSTESETKTTQTDNRINDVSRGSVDNSQNSLGKPVN